MTKKNYCPVCQSPMRLLATTKEVREECERCGYSNRIRVRVVAPITIND